MSARGGSRHIDFLLKNNLVRTSPSTLLGLAYAVARMENEVKNLSDEVNEAGVIASDKCIPNGVGEKMLLSESSGQLIADSLDVPELAVEIKRAVWQEERSLRARQEYQEEKQEIEEATKKPDR